MAEAPSEMETRESIQGSPPHDHPELQPDPQVPGAGHSESVTEQKTELEEKRAESPQEDAGSSSSVYQSTDNGKASRYAPSTPLSAAAQIYPDMDITEGRMAENMYQIPSSYKISLMNQNDLLAIANMLHLPEKEFPTIQSLRTYLIELHERVSRRLLQQQHYASRVQQAQPVTRVNPLPENPNLLQGSV